ncbi:DUF1778 domain-containing protein [Xenococcus sp. PCC 7305]|uniref:type II toxin-antitoxin system TacA family antitoxin n=1 Tax=Xenococcus sp. PCC 7305 TaxID=102125 RepID=UPI002101C93B|nr:DUF1778 domain-containing protein [Xenococcus sp. PCC 7305]
MRVNSEEKKLLEQAASIKGLGLSAYMLSLTLTSAREDIAAYQKLTLSNKEWDIFVSALENPDEPNTSLTKAAIRRITY